MASTDGPLSLFQHGDDWKIHHYLDHENRLAFTLEEFSQTGLNMNRVVRLVREPEWINQHQNIMGPDRSYFYMGPTDNLGYIMYGNGTQNLPMTFMLRPGKREGSVSRYWRGQNGLDYKWKVTTHRMECFDAARNRLALWEVSLPDKNYYAKLTLYPRAMPLVTEVLTTLILNQMALSLTWDLTSP